MKLSLSEREYVEENLHKKPYRTDTRGGFKEVEVSTLRRAVPKVKGKANVKAAKRARQASLRRNEQ